MLKYSFIAKKDLEKKMNRLVTLVYFSFDTTKRTKRKKT